MQRQRPLIDNQLKVLLVERMRLPRCKSCFGVRIELYPTPNIVKQNLQQLLEKVDFVDRIIFGRMNYNKEVTAFKDHIQFFMIVRI